MKMKKLPVFLIAAALCSHLACSSAEPSGPDVRIVNLAGLEAALDEHRGKGILLNFWAIWCAPCVEELPDLIEVGKEYHRHGGVVVLVSYDLMVPDVTPEGILQQVTEFAADRGMHLPILIYDDDDYESINERFGLPGPIPATVAINAEGEIVDREDAHADKSRFIAMMERAVGSTPSK
jgi:thiol-disulfide isomerase/thioredoxin